MHVELDIFSHWWRQRERGGRWLEVGKLYGPFTSSWFLCHQRQPYIWRSGSRQPLHVTSVPSTALRICYDLIKTYTSLLVCPPVHLRACPTSERLKERARTLRFCFLADNFKEQSLKTQYFSELGNWFTGRWSLDLGLICSILLPTELTTTIITLESITHHSLLRRLQHICIYLVWEQLWE